MSEEQIGELGSFETSDCYDDTEKNVLRFAEQLTETTHVDNSVVESLKDSFSERELVELALTVGTANLTNRINHAFDVPLEDE